MNRQYLGWFNYRWLDILHTKLELTCLSDFVHVHVCVCVHLTLMVLSDEPLTKRLSCRWRHLTVPEWPARVRAAHTVFVRRFHMYIDVCTSMYIHVYMHHIEHLHVHMLYIYTLYVYNVTCSYSFEFGMRSSGVYLQRWCKLCRRCVPPKGCWVSETSLRSVLCAHDMQYAYSWSPQCSW